MFEKKCEFKNKKTRSKGFYANVKILGLFSLKNVCANQTLY